MARLWAKIIVKHKIKEQATMPSAFEDAQQTLSEMCREFDIPSPIWLGKQEREFENFRLTSFGPENFVEEIHFQKLEIEFLEDDDKKRKSRDPRNAF